MSAEVEIGAQGFAKRIMAADLRSEVYRDHQAAVASQSFQSLISRIFENETIHATIDHRLIALYIDGDQENEEAYLVGQRQYRELREKVALVYSVTVERMEKADKAWSKGFAQSVHCDD